MLSQPFWQLEYKRRDGGVESPFTKVGNHTVCVKVIADNIEKQKCVKIVVPVLYLSVYSYVIVSKSPFNNILFMWIVVTIIILLILGRTKYVFKF